MLGGNYRTKPKGTATELSTLCYSEEAKTCFAKVQNSTRRNNIQTKKRKAVLIKHLPKPNLKSN